MRAPLAAELLKLRTVRSTWGYVGAVAGFAALVTAGTIGADRETARVTDDFQFRLVLDGTAPALVIGLLLACIVVTSEFRHGTITPTLLVLPRRELLVAVKLVAGVLAAAGLAVVALVTVGLISIVWLTALDVPLQGDEVAGALGRAALAIVVVGAAGAAVGGAVQSQVAALVGILVWLFVAEPILWALTGLLGLDWLPDYLPAGTTIGIADPSGDGLPLAAKVLVGLGWVAVAGGLAALRLHRRDVT